MGNTLGSRKGRLSAKEARALAGDKFDQQAFDALARRSADDDGKVPVAELAAALERDGAGEAGKCPFAGTADFGGPDPHAVSRRPSSEDKNGAAGERDAVAEREERVKSILARQTVTERVDLSRNRGAMVHSAATRALVEDVGESIVPAVTRFYDKAFEDPHMDQFIRRHDDPHGERLGMWIIEKMGAGPVWTQSRPRDARSQAHRDAWTSPKRKPEHIGRRFKLNDCRNWMRLFFWAFREEGLDEHQPFWHWLVSFIEHFIAVYEYTAPPYTRGDSMWSADKQNIDRYLAEGRYMTDLHGQRR